MSKKSKTNGDNSKLVGVAELLEVTGKYQILQYFYVCLPAIFVSMINVNYIFVAGEVDFRCSVPECETNSTYDAAWWPKTHTDQCTKPILNTTLSNQCTNESFTGETEPCTKWIYENDNSIVSKLNLACQPWKRSVVGPVHSIGMGLAMIIAGWLSDNIGRKPTHIICALACVVGNFKTLATSYPVYITLEFLEAVVTGGALTAGNVLLIEIGSRKNRMLAGVLFAYAIYMGEAVFALIAMFVPYWRSLILIVCSPAILFLLYIIILRESPRWLILNGKLDKAKYVLREMIEKNNINANLEELDRVTANQLKEAYNIETERKREGFREVFGSKEVLKRLVVAFECRFAVAFIYYGLLANSVSLPGDKYVNFLIGAIMSFPGELVSLYMMNKFGRRLPLLYGYLVTAVACIVYGYVPESIPALKITFFFLGKLMSSACYTGIVTYAMELSPTSVRGSLLGLCTLAACSGTMLGLLTPMMASVSSVLAPICFAVLAILSSCLLTLTPETRDLPLPDTIEQITKNTKVDKNVTGDYNNPAYIEDYRF